MSKEAASSATPTNDVKTPPAEQVIEGEFKEVKEGDPKPPRVARPADVKPLSSTAGDVFGGDVNDTSNAKRARPDAAQGAPKGKPRGKAKAAPEPVDPEKYLSTARGFLMTGDVLFRGYIKSRYADVLEEESLRKLDAQMALGEANIDAMAEPLAEGLAEEGVELPWWAKLAMAGAAVYAPKLAALSKLETMRDEHEKRQAAPRGA